MQEFPRTAVAATHTAILPVVERDSRWLEWQARGVANDRQTSTRMRVVMALIVVALIAWTVYQLT